MLCEGSISDAEWSIGIVACRESPAILKTTIQAALRACRQKRSVIDVLVNGNLGLASVTADYLRTVHSSGNPSAEIRLWYIPLGDKAHTWNLHVHEIGSSDAAVTFYIDGYAEVMPDALELLAAGLASDSRKLGATGVPTTGRSASMIRARMLRDGGLHGNLFALPRSVMHELRDSCFKLPIGLYRTDSVIGAVLSFGLDPRHNEWEPKRILVHPSATWHTPPQSMFEFAAIRGHLRRKVRQARGLLENEAIKQHLAVEQRSPSELPEFADELIVSWTNNSRREAFRLCARNWLCSLALRKARGGRPASVNSLSAELLATRACAP